MRSTPALALLLLLALLSAFAVHAVRVRDGDDQLSGGEIELEEASEIEQEAHHWQFSPLVRHAPGQHTRAYLDLFRVMRASFGLSFAHAVFLMIEASLKPF